MKIAVLWSRCGPYHLARLAGAQRAAAEFGAAVQGFEVAADDGVYDWSPLAAGDGGRRTLFPAQPYEAVPARRLRRAVGRALDEHGCDVVAVNGWSVVEARAGIDWRRAAPGRRAVLMSETQHHDERRWPWKECLKRRIVARCDAALVGGRSQAAYLGTLGFPAKRVFTGYNAVDNDFFERQSNDARRQADILRHRHGLPPRFFLACSRLLKKKNHHRLLRAYARYRRDAGTQPWHLVIVGSGPEQTRLQRLARSLGLHDVIWPGFVQYDLLPVYYALASAFVHPAVAEAWGLVVNEAAACGLPLLVSSAVGARHELVDDGANGYLFDPLDVHAMAERLRRVAALDDTSRRQLGARSRTIVAAWSPDNFGRQLLRAAQHAVSLSER